MIMIERCGSQESIVLHRAHRADLDVVYCCKPSLLPAPESDMLVIPCLKTDVIQYMGHYTSKAIHDLLRATRNFPPCFANNPRSNLLS